MNYVQQSVTIDNTNSLIVYYITFNPDEVGYLLKSDSIYEDATK